MNGICRSCGAPDIDDGSNPCQVCGNWPGDDPVQLRAAARSEEEAMRRQVGKRLHAEKKALRRQVFA